MLRAWLGVVRDSGLGKTKENWKIWFVSNETEWFQEVVGGPGLCVLGAVYVLKPRWKAEGLVEGRQ